MSEVSNTVEDQRGPGRRLNQFTGWLGKKVEGLAGRVLALLLPTPEALRRRIKELLEAKILLLAFEEAKEEWKAGLAQGWAGILEDFTAEERSLLLKSQWQELRQDLQGRVCTKELELKSAKLRCSYRGTRGLTDQEKYQLMRDCKALLKHTKYILPPIPHHY